MRRRGFPLLWPVGLALAIGAEWVRFGWDDPRHWIPDLATGLTLIVCGLVAWSRRPASLVGVLLFATGFSWFIGNFSSVAVGGLAWVAGQAVYLYRGPLIHALFVYPRQRLASRVERSAVVLGYVAAVVAWVWRSPGPAMVLAGLLVVASACCYQQSAGPMRRARLTSLWASTAVGFVLAGQAAARLLSPSSETNYLSLLVFEGTLCAVAAALLTGLLSASWERAAVTDLVVDLGDSQSGTLREELARALADPSLEVGYWLPDLRAYVDFEGRPLTLPASGSERSVTLVEREAQPVAVLLHDPAVLSDPGLLEAVALATRLGASNARLQAEVRTHVAELRASRRRILEAGDEERFSLERRLHEGSEHRLARLAEMLRRARLASRAEATIKRIGRAEDQLEQTLDELRQLAHGLHPRVLSEYGLERALAELAERASLPVTVSVTCNELPAQVEDGAYFVCSEGLANAIKHAAASRVLLSVTKGGGPVRVEVEDDGSGGADQARGLGLRGLADRVEALGGTLQVESPPRGGTRLVAEFPLG